MRLAQIKLYERGKLIEKFQVEPVRDVKITLEWLLKELKRETKSEWIEQRTPTKLPVLFDFRIPPFKILVVEKGNW